MAQGAWRKAPLRLREWLSAPVRRRLHSVLDCNIWRYS